MRRLVVTTFVSVDGVMQSPGAPDEDRSGGFELGGWLVPYVDASTAAFAVEWIQQARGLLLGRKSYEILAAHWPEHHRPQRRARRASQHLAEVCRVDDPHRTDVGTGDRHLRRPRHRDPRLKADGEGELQVHGSRSLARSLIDLDLVDEYRLWVFPVLLGSGERSSATASHPWGCAWSAREPPSQASSSTRTNLRVL